MGGRDAAHRRRRPQGQGPAAGGADGQVGVRLRRPPAGHAPPAAGEGRACGPRVLLGVSLGYGVNRGWEAA